MIKIYKNTSTLNGYDEGLSFTRSKNEAEVVLMGSKKIDMEEFPNLKGVFRAGVGKDNVPKVDQEKEIVIGYPSDKTSSIIFEETANFTCSLIFRMLYNNIGTIDKWFKEPRKPFSSYNLCVIGMGNIGERVAQKMSKFVNVYTYDILHNNKKDLEEFIKEADCITLHIPKNDSNTSFFGIEKFSWMKKGSSLINTARGALYDENELYKYLKIGKIKAAFDVFWSEPYNGKLEEFYPDPFFMTPHVASTCSSFLKGCREDLDKFLSNLD